MRRFISILSLLLIAPLLNALEAKYTTIDEAIARGALADVQLQIKIYPERLDQSKNPKLSPLNQAILRKQVAIAL
ncbi:MAG: hypothetical protein P8I96_01710, partial [Opitutae bacterium]|nr:hypothetical protein [Opitutae bacterium]